MSNVLETKSAEPFALIQNNGGNPLELAPDRHLLGKEMICGTEDKGFANPGNRAPTEIVLDASDGFIPLWRPNRVLWWSFNESSMKAFANPEQAKDAVRQLFREALLAWGDAVPIQFKETDSGWDFEFFMHNANSGGVLASAFFPDSGRHRLELYPLMFTQSRKEQVDTLVHEIGHVFGLRHFFANISENEWPSEIFGKHEKFTIMNYGELSALTDTDKADLKELYKAVWSSQLTKINGTPFKLFEPFHESGSHPV